MAGHSKFANIKHRKGAQDKKRAKIFSRLSKEITIAAKMGLPDPDANPRLRTAIAAARAQNMPKDNIERAIKKSADAGGDNFEEVRYEGFGPGGIGIIVETLTDNRNRTAGDVRATFQKMVAIWAKQVRFRLCLTAAGRLPIRQKQLMLTVFLKQRLRRALKMFQALKMDMRLFVRWKICIR